MQLYKTLALRTAQLEKIYAELGGRYSFWERLKRNGIGSPMLFYQDGTAQLDQLQSLAPDEIRINFELLKAGILLRIAERTNSYFIPIAKAEIATLQLVKEPQKMYLQLTTISKQVFTFWGNVDQYYGWQVFIEHSFLADFIERN